MCNTVYYSLMSACSVCQNVSFVSWTTWSANCTNTHTETFPFPIPTYITVPHYAYLDVVTGNTFDVTAAENAGGPESTAPPTATSTTIVTATSTPIAQSSKLNAGAIAGSVVGGVVFLGIVAGLAFMQGRKFRPSHPAFSKYYAYGRDQ
jgi:hypothetical protein